MAINANFKIKNGLNLNGQLISSLAIGTSPFSLSSTTLNTHLNADLLDDQHGAYYLDFNNFTNLPTFLKSIAYGDSITESSTTSTTLQTKLSQAFTLSETKTIIINWGAQMRISANNRDMRVLISLDGVTLAENVNRFGTTSGGTFYFSGPSYRISCNTGTHTILLQYAATSSGGTCYISKTHVEAFQL